MSFCSKVPLHLPRGRMLHLFESGSMYSLHPEDISKSLQALSTSKNSYIAVITGFAIIKVSNHFVPGLKWMKQLGQTLGESVLLCLVVFSDKPEVDLSHNRTTLRYDHRLA